MDGGCEELCPPPRGRYDPRASLHPRRARGAARSGAVSTHQPIDARQSGPRARGAAMVSRRRSRDSRERHPTRPVPPLPHQLARYARLVNPAGPGPNPARPKSLCGVKAGSSDCRMSLFATKPIATLRAEAEATGEHALTRALGPLNLVTLGIGAVIGAGIFVITGQVAALYAGPAVPLSMILVGVACAFAGLCYAEMASAVPVAGSAYTYAYATMGEFAAWIIGWDLVLEYAAGAATVGVGWSGHFVSLLGLFGIRIPASLTAPPTQLCTMAQVTAHAVGCAHTGLNLTGAIINLPAVGIVALMSAVLVIGIKESARVNSLIVILKVGIVLLVVLVGLPHVRPANWTPFIPPNTGEWGSYGWSGVLRGARLGVGSVILVMLLGQSRVFYAMSRDGLLGPWAGRVHPRFRTPYLSTIYTGIAVCFATGLLPLQLLGTWVNIGTLLAFVLVCAGVWILRHTRPDLERPFRAPLVPFVPLMGILSCLGLMVTLPLDTWVRLFVWLALGLAVYFGYGRRHSVLGK